ncbi:MAG: anthranilate synthase component I [Deltaproteobacteria bacterium]|jgi:anthranilate synthase component 1|nr:anthranilate synthase component I [Deltaproteobacteria bacterium]MBW2503362.1 anthranilate synthase component I [Deltaproteobacteria bacterium]
MHFPSFDNFQKHAQRGNLIPVYREILADMETPVSAFCKVDDHRSTFLLESIEGGEKWARYSFLGFGSGKAFRCRGEYYETLENFEVIGSGTTSQPLDELKKFLAPFQPVALPELPPFYGGAVGYLGYDMVRHVEELPAEKPAEIGTWDSWFLITETLLIFDNMLQKIKVVSNVHLLEGDDPLEKYQKAVAQIDTLVSRLRGTMPERPNLFNSQGDPELRSNFSRESFERAVERCKEFVRAGDVIQVVLSQRFSGHLDVDPLNIYRALRTINPSPYMFYLQFEKTRIIGASPEVLVRKVGKQVEVRPIAGTRPRGKTVEEDNRLEEELLIDPKERAEHIMLVDLGRNDLGRVCETGSVSVDEMMVIERYSHVMHIVSNVSGTLMPGRDAIDVFAATFPAGTLSGAPKIRAMEIIEELEPCRREIYGGAVGYISFDGNMDLAIAIRTLVVHDGKVYLQAGAGIVADSVPASEFQETVDKAMGVKKAIEMARRGLD